MSNNKRATLEGIYECLKKLALATDSEQSLLIEKELLVKIESLDPDQKNENNELLQPLHLYFIALYNKGRLTLDSSAENPSISLFTDFFLNNKDTVLKRFNKSGLQKVIMTLILSNLSIHRVQHADSILKEWIDIFSEDYKAAMFIRILNAPCGKLDNKYLTDLFDLSLKTYDAFSSFKTKVEYLNKIYYLEKGTLINNPHMGELLKRFSEASSGHSDASIRMLYREFCLNNEHLDLIENWKDSLDMESLDDIENKMVKELMYLLEERRKGNDFVRISDNEERPDDPENAHNISNIRRHQSDKRYKLENLLKDIEKGIEINGERAVKGETPDIRISALIVSNELQLMKPSVDFWNKQEKALKRIVANNNEKIDDAIFIAVNEYSLVNAATTFPFLLEAKRKGIPCYSFSPKMHLDICDENDSFYDLYGMIDDGRDKKTNPNNDISDVRIDIGNKEIIIDGMNVYQPIFEIISRYQFTYEYRFESDAWARYRTVFLIRKFKALFDYIKRVEKWAKEYSKRVYFISNAPHIHNAAAFRIYCEDKGYKSNLNFICTSPGYDNYFLNSTDSRSQTTTAINMTKHIDCRNSFLGTKEGFEKYYSDNQYRIDEIRQKMQSYLEVRRSNRAISFKQWLDKKKILRKIERERKRGKTIILLNGKVILDLGVKYTKGCVHNDMSEWITHAVSFANANSDNVILLIKPHPHESRQDLTMTSENIDTLKSIIHTDIGKAIYLDNNLFTNFELAPHVDLCMVWNGTSAVEFAAEGKKVLVADEWGHKDYPIGFCYPKDIGEYESYMLDINKMNDMDDLQDRAITFLEYIGSDDVRVKNNYLQTTLMNFNQSESIIVEEGVSDFIENGNDNLKKYFEGLM